MLVFQASPATSLYFYVIDVFYISPALPTMKRTI